VGWKPLPEIQKLFSTIPILSSKFLGSGNVHFNAETLKKIVYQILSASDAEIVEIYETLKSTPKADFGSHGYIPELLPRLAEQYSKEDPGNLVALLTMNFLTLQKGDAIYVPADGIHAYLSGDIVECMARSDNVLNTGFCPRADRDSVELFTAALTFSPRSAEEAILKAIKSDKGTQGHTEVLAPPMSEFNMLHVDLAKGEKESLKALQGPAVMVVTHGQGKMKSADGEVDVKEGYVFFIGYDTAVEFEAAEGLETYIAYAEA
jgi:mannose-6-phosphate isomerase